jgi:hypothetical protein
LSSRHPAPENAAPLAAAFLLCAAAALTGCGSGNLSSSTSTYPGVSFSATVLAGTKPIAGASVQLYVYGTATKGVSASSSLGSPPVITDANGVATIASNYNCLQATSPLYLISSGGTVSGTNSSNGASVLMATVGTCSSITTSTKVTINEATTVASIEALAQFYSPTAAINASATNLTGLTNAFATAATLADPFTGAVPGSTMPSNAIAPTARINTIANLVNACVVSASACGAFFTAVGTSGAVPANTLDAVYDLVRSPASNVATLYTLSKASSAYTPALTAAPTDWTLFITYSGAGLNSPSGLGVDSTGSVWVANYFDYASKFSPIGAPVFANGITGFGLNNSYGLAIDPSDNAWIPNEQPYTADGIGSVSVLTPTGTSAAGPSGYIAGGFNYPLSVAIDPNGTAWVVDYGNSHVTLLNSSGQPLSGSAGYTTPSFAFPVVVAVNANHFGWVGNLSDTNVTKVAPDGSSFTSYSCCEGAAGIAIDQSNNVWIANFYGASVSMISSTGTIVSKLGYTGLGSIDHPQGIAVDGAGNIWVANYRAPSLTELAGASAAAPGTSLSPAAGFGADTQLLEAYALALDASGNIWVSNQGSNTVTKFIGLAAPVKTPLSGLPKLP